MSTTCAKDGNMSTFQSSKNTREEYKRGLEISDSIDPFENPLNEVAQWTNPRTGQVNQKIVGGPDKGVHRFVDPNTGRGGQTGITRFTKRGEEYRQDDDR